MIDHLSAILRAWVSDAIVLTMWFLPHRKRHVMFANIVVCVAAVCGLYHALYAMPFVTPPPSPMF